MSQLAGVDSWTRGRAKSLESNRYYIFREWFGDRGTHGRVVGTSTEEFPVTITT